MIETDIEKHYRETLEYVGEYAIKRERIVYCDHIAKVIINKLKEGKDLLSKSKSHRFRIGITQRHDFKDREGDISNAAWRLHLEQKKASMKIQDKELGKLLMVGKTHTARIAEGK